MFVCVCVSCMFVCIMYVCVCVYHVCLCVRVMHVCVYVSCMFVRVYHVCLCVCVSCMFVCMFLAMCTLTLFHRAWHSSTIIICTFENLSLGSLVVMMGSMTRLLPNTTSGMYRAHTTWAHPPVSVRFRAPSLRGQSSQRWKEKCQYHTSHQSYPHPSTSLIPSLPPSLPPCWDTINIFSKGCSSDLSGQLKSMLKCTM